MLNKLLHNILSFLPVAIFAMLTGMLGACSNDIPQLPAEDAEIQEINVKFRISTSSETQTRNVIFEQYGSPIENSIDADDFAVLLFDDNGVEKRLLEILYLDGATAPNATLTPLGMGDYTLNVKLDPELYSTSSRFSIVALANWDSLREKNDEIELIEGVTTLESLFEHTFRLNNEGGSGGTESWMPDNDSLIPMFGVLYCSLGGYSTSLYNEANPMEMGMVNLLRALVKIEVIDNSSNPLAEIKSITLNRRNTRGYLTHRYAASGNTEQVTSANVPAMIGESNPAGYSNTPINFRKEGKKYVVYVPEIELSEEMALKTREYIDVTIAYKGVTEVRHILLAPYDKSGNPYVPRDGWDNVWKALLRNHIYRFTINSINVDPNLELTVDVQPYSSVQLPVDFGLERTEDGYIVVRDKEGNVIKYIRTDGSILTLSPDKTWPEIGEFTGVFDSWKRVLVGYFPDGRRVIFNYDSDNQDDNKVLSWEIYSSSRSSLPSHIMETFSFIDGKEHGDTGLGGSDEILTPAFTWSALDQYGRLISQLTFTSRDHFKSYRSDPDKAVPPVKRVSYTGQRYEDKVISYYGQDGKIYCQIKVTGDQEQYIYDNFIND